MAIIKIPFLRQPTKALTASEAAFFGIGGGGDGTEIANTNTGFTKAYLNSVWVHRCVTAIANAVAQAEPRFYKVRADGLREQLDNHPLLKMIINVNNYSMNFSDLMKATVSAYMLYGDAYWYLEGDKAPESILFIHPDRILPIDSDTKWISGYQLYDDVGQKVGPPIPPERILHFKTFNPDPEARTGISFITAIRDSIQLDLQQRGYNKAFFKNSGRVDAVLQTDNKLTKEGYNRVSRYWRRSFQGVNNAHRMAILEQGLKYQPIAVAPKDAEWVNQAKISRLEICAVAGVPLTVAGAEEAANFATALEHKRSFYEETALPLLITMVEVIQWGLVSVFAPDVEVTFDLSHIDALSEAKKDRHERIRSDLLSGLITVNEARAINYPELAPIDGGDVLYVPVNVFPMEKPEMVEQDPPSRDQSQDETDNNRQREESAREQLISDIERGFVMLTLPLMEARARHLPERPVIRQINRYRLRERRVKFLSAPRPITNKTADKVEA